MRERPRLSVRLFAWMAHRLLPEDFRRQLGAPLVDAFEDAMKETKGLEDRTLLLMRELSSLLASLYGCVALAIAAIGIYGAASQSVKLRTREIGIRMAMGAIASDVIRQVAGDGIKWVLVGALLGLLGTMLASGLLASRLYGVSELGDSRLLAVVSILILVALAACSVPVREASRVDPTRALRQD